MPKLQSFDDSAHTKICPQQRNYCKGAFQEEIINKSNKKVHKKLKKMWNKENEPPGLLKQKPPKPPTNLTDDIVNQYVQEHPDTVSTYLRNERSMKAQRKQIHVRSLLNNAF